MEMSREMDFALLELTPIGRVESPLTDRASAPKQGHEEAPDAWLVFEPAVVDGLQGIRVGDRVIVLTWLDRARRDRPNPIGLHEVEVVAIDGQRVLVHNLEALNGTPILDVKPVLRRG